MDAVNPGWNALEVAYRDTDGTALADQVTATLYRVSNANGGVWAITGAAFNSNLSADTVDNIELVPFNYTFDFFNYAYFVEIQVKRSSSTTEHNPTISIVRLVETIF